MRLIGPFLPDRLRSSRTLLSLLGVFFAAQIPLGLLVDRNPDVRFPWSAAIAARVRQEGHPPEVLLLGSSRTMGLFPAAEAPSRRPAPPEPWILNAASPACAAPCAENVLLGILGASPGAPRLAIVEVSPEIVGLTVPWLEHDIVRTLTWRDVPATLPSLVRSRAVMTLVASRLDTVYRHRQHLWSLGLAALGGDPRALDPPEEGPRTQPPQPQAMEAAARDYRRRLRDYRTGGMNVAALRRILEGCKRRNIQTVLFSTPLSHWHRELYGADVETRYRALLDALVSAYGCRHLDWRSRFPDDRFRDSHHLNLSGALETTIALRRAVVDPLGSASR